MTKITQRQLIQSLEQLKEIKPRKEWAYLLKSQILSESVSKTEIISTPSKFVGIMDNVLSVFAPRKMAYSFAVLLFLVVGMFGFAKYTMPGDLLFPIKKIAEQSQATLAGESVLHDSVLTLNNRINDLAKITKEGRTNNIIPAIDEVKINASILAKNLKEDLIRDKETIKEIIVSLKTLAAVPGTDLSSNTDVQDLYQVVSQSQIDDLEKTTLTDDQIIVLTEIKFLYDEGQYVDALEKILLINK